MRNYSLLDLDQSLVARGIEIMKKYLVLVPALLISQNAAFSQVIIPTPSRIAYVESNKDLKVDIDNSADVRTARQRVLDSKYPMPEMGLGESIAALEGRIDYAQSHGWLQQATAEMLAGKYAQIKDSVGKGSHSLAYDVFNLNQSLVQAVGNEEQSLPGREGLAARGLILRQQLRIARIDENLSSKKVKEINQQLAVASQELQTADLNQTEVNSITSKLAGIEKQLHIENRNIAAKGQFQ